MALHGEVGEYSSFTLSVKQIIVAANKIKEAVWEHERQIIQSFKYHLFQSADGKEIQCLQFLKHTWYYDQLF